MAGLRHIVALWWLAGFAALVALIAWARWRRQRDLEMMGDARLVRRMIPVESPGRRVIKDALVGTAFLFIVIAAAGPQYGAKLKEIRTRGIDVFIALDVSRSMLARDAQPNRLAQAKRTLSDLISRLDGNRVGVIAFAGDAVVQCPLTIDRQAALMFLDALDENAVGRPGTAIGSAVRLALASFPKDAGGARAVILLTDGEDHHSDAAGAAREAKDAGVPLFGIGIGTTKGEVIEQRDESGNVVEYMKHEGQIVVSRLDEGLLSQMAVLTGGAYFRASSTGIEAEEIAGILNGFDKRDLATRLHDRLEDRYQIPLALAVLLIMIELFLSETAGAARRSREILIALWKRRKSAVAPLILLLATAGPAYADWRALTREGAARFDKGDFEGAVKLFEAARDENPASDVAAYNLGTALLAVGRHELAEKAFHDAITATKSRRLHARATYNLGHVRLKAGDRSGAIEQWKECLRLTPHDRDAKYNIEYVLTGKEPPSAGGRPKPSEGGGEQEKKDASASSTPAQDGKSQDAKQNPEALSQENAERVLQMMSDQERQRLRELMAARAKKNPKAAPVGEDW